MVRVYNCDVLIVGCGPAGAMAGLGAARGGARTLIIERKKDIGFPERCGESLAGLHTYEKRLGIKIDPACIANDEVRGMQLYSGSGKASPVIETTSSVVERRLFDKCLAKQAVAAGAELWIQTNALEVLKEKGFVHGVTAKRDGEAVEIHARVVIGADGFSSGVCRGVGLKRPRVSFQCYSFEVANVNYDHHIFPCFVSYDFAPGAHAWWVPKGKNTANIGVGVLTGYDRDKTSLREYYRRFTQHPVVSKWLKGGQATALLTGATWYGAPAEKTYGNGVLLAGDAGSIVWVTHGAGIAMSMSSGYMAGEAAAQAVKDGDVSAGRLARYEEKWKSTIGKSVFAHVESARLIREMVRSNEQIEKAMTEIPRDFLGVLIFSRGHNEVAREWLDSYNKVAAR